MEMSYLCAATRKNGDSGQLHGRSAVYGQFGGLDPIHGRVAVQSLRERHLELQKRRVRDRGVDPDHAARVHETEPLIAQIVLERRQRHLKSEAGEGIPRIRLRALERLKTNAAHRFVVGREQLLELVRALDVRAMKVRLSGTVDVDNGLGAPVLRVRARDGGVIPIRRRTALRTDRHFRSEVLRQNRTKAFEVHFLLPLLPRLDLVTRRLTCLAALLAVLEVCLTAFLITLSARLSDRVRSFDNFFASFSAALTNFSKEVFFFRI
jgi:hypothetical protein